MNYLIYQITNTKNGKIYIGAHKTETMNDGYMGSGKYLQRAIKKYGIEFFKKIILFELADEKKMFAKEADIVDEEFILREDTYNLKVGGFGGFNYINQNGIRATEKGKPASDACYEAVRLGHKQGKYKYDTFTGQVHTVETIEKMRIGHKGKHVGSKNSQYGTMWITDGSNNKKLKKDDLIPEGWRKGRIIKGM